MSNLFNLFNPTYPKPKTIFWWLEAMCNLRCNHCDIGKKSLIAKFKPDLTLDQKKEVLDKLETWMEAPYSLSFIMGEPFLYQHMVEILTYAHQHNATTSLTSNGTLLASPKFAEKVVRSGLNFIALSLESLNGDIHDISRGQTGVRDKVLKAVKNLKFYKKKYNRQTPIIYINSIIMKDNLDDLESLVKWVKTERIDGITFQPIASPDIFAGDGLLGREWFKTSKLWPNTTDVLSHIDTLEKLKGCGFPIQNSKSDFARFRRYFKNPLRFYDEENCESELHSLVITSNGDIKMCPNRIETLGNILKNDLDEVWRSSAANEARKHVNTCKSETKILATSKTDFYF